MIHISVTDTWKVAEEMAELKRENARLQKELKDITDQFFAVSQENAALREELKLWHRSSKWLREWAGYMRELEVKKETQS